MIHLNFLPSPCASGVYMIRNRLTKDTYVGSAHDFEKRWKLHRLNLRAARHHSPHLQRAWLKYGEAAFEFVVLQRCPKERVIGVEQEWIDLLTAKYNVSRTAGSRAGVKNRPEHNRAISERARARWADPEFKARMREKMAAVATGVKPPAKNDKLVTAFGRTQRLQDWAEETGIKRETIAWRLRAGKTPEEALTPGDRRSRR